MTRSTDDSLPADIEMIDLTEDQQEAPRRPIVLRDEGEKVPLIHDLTEDDEDEDGTDGLRPVDKDELRGLGLDFPAISRRTTAGSVVTETGFTVEIGSGVELLYREEHELFKVKQLFLDKNSNWQMKGVLLIRARSSNNMLQKQPNEVFALVKALVDDKGRMPDVYEYLVTRPLSSVICTRDIIFTNQPFPAHSFREKGKGYKAWMDVEEQAELVCRYKFVTFYDTVTWNVPSEALVRLRRHECDIGVPDAQLMLDWHCPRTNTKQHRPSHSATTSHRKTSTRQVIPKEKVYTYADVCAGAGGTTTAAKRTGFNITWALDHAEDPCNTLQLNYPSAKILNMDVFEFCTTTSINGNYIVDVMHISFPCQTYSTLHVHAGRNDAANEAAGYSVIPLLTNCRPRIVTFEQSPNMARQHLPSFQALIHQITTLGYSVRWKVVNFADTGNVHSRNRLFVIASCPGEPLPPFPKPTHGNEPGQRKPTTVADILRQVPNDIDSHMAETVDWRSLKDVMPYNAERPLRAAITCDGGESNLHPNGKRPFNNQELAQLQGFPATYIFFGRKRSIMRQIGNAVPGKAATPFFREIMKSLKKFDEEVEEYQNEIIEID